MPRVSAFYGIVIRMYSDEGVHGGRPHFHAEYAGVKASYDIRAVKPIAGRLHPRANRLVTEWGRMHQFELRRNWQLARARQPLRPIDPLC
jgi:uncharacterized protein DUF4160